MIEFPKNRPILIMSVILALAFIAFGGMKFTSPEELLTNFEIWGYPNGFHFVVGGLEVAGAIGLFLRPFARYSALLLGVLMIGAFGTHVMNPPIAAGSISLVLGIISFATFYLHTKDGAPE
jgi:uncharacterized membrane protein YphA (DoxX/SURF4 family)